MSGEEIFHSLDTAHQSAGIIGKDLIAFAKSLHIFVLLPRWQTGILIVFKID
jgi:hypothetical protein